MKNVFFYGKDMPQYLQYMFPSLVIISTKDQDKFDAMAFKNWLYHADGGFILFFLFFYF
jgi:hypothetical protein